MEDSLDIQTPLLHPEDPIHQDASLTIPEGTTRKISTSTFHTFSSTESSDSGVSVAHFYTVPNILRSVDTLVYLGFTLDCAERVWSRWCSIDEDGKYPLGPWDLLDVALKDVEDKEEEGEFSPSARDGKMESWGIGKEAREACLAPEHWDLLATELAKFWVLEMFHLRWNVLEDIWETTKEEADLRGGGKKIDVLAAPPSPTPGHTTLFRGTEKKILENFLRDGSVEALHSKWPSDFRGLAGPILFFALDFEVAHGYAKWAVQAAEGSVMKVLFMQVPNELIQRFRPCLLRVDRSTTGAWDPRDWKQIIYASRMGTPFPKQLKSLQHRPLFIRHICRVQHTAITQLRSWEEIQPEKHAWLLEEGPNGKRYATQYVFNGTEIMEALNEEASIGVCDL